MVFSAKTSRTEGALRELAAEDAEDLTPPISRCCWSPEMSAPTLTTDVILWSFLIACLGSLTVLSAEIYSFDLNWASCWWSRSSCRVEGMSIRFLFDWRFQIRWTGKIIGVCEREKGIKWWRRGEKGRKERNEKGLVKLVLEKGRLDRQKGPAVFIVHWRNKKGCRPRTTKGICKE
jgi:hypothetical protein